MSENKKLIFTSPSFENNGFIPLENTARGEDKSPEFHLENISENAVSIAITLDDASHPIFPNYNHWLIWNLPVSSVICGNIPKGECLKSYSNAMQGIAYGKHCYKGPKPPFHSVHDYVFTVYILDCMLDLPSKSKREDLFTAMYGHILQKSMIKCKFQSGKKS